MTCSFRVVVTMCVAFGLGLSCATRAESAVRVPSCAQFIDFGARWIGIDEAVAAQVLGVPLYALTDADINLVANGLQACIAAADTPETKALLQENVKHIPSLRAARDRVRHAFADFDAAKRAAKPKLVQLAARVDALPATPRSRGAIDDAEATVSAIFFELEQKRLRAQVTEPLTENYAPYAVAMAAIARKHAAYAEQEQEQLLGQAQGAFERQRAAFDRLGLPAEALEATIILQDIDAGKSVRWLTLRQWAALTLDNAENTDVKVEPRSRPGEAAAFTVEVVRPGYGTAEFGFRQDGRDLLLVQSGVDGKLADIAGPDKRREANELLVAVARER